MGTKNMNMFGNVLRITIVLERSKMSTKVEILICFKTPILDNLHES